MTHLTHEHFEVHIYLMKSQKSIQNRPSSARWAHSSFFRLGGHLGQLSDQGPVQEKRPHGFLSCSNLRQEVQRIKVFFSSRYKVTCYGEGLTLKYKIHTYSVLV